MDNAQVTVTQADREAAARAGLELGRLSERDAEACQKGGAWDEWSLVLAFARHRLERSEPVGWMGIDSAPVNTPVRIKAGNMTFLARLVPDASMSDLDTACDQWQAEIEGEHPPCWSGGACWASNEDGVTSLQPTAWRYPGGTPEPVAEIERLRGALVSIARETVGVVPEVLNLQMCIHTVNDVARAALGDAS